MQKCGRQAATAFQISRLGGSQIVASSENLTFLDPDFDTDKEKLKIKFVKNENYAFAWM